MQKDSFEILQLFKKQIYFLRLFDVENRVKFNQRCCFQCRNNLRKCFLYECTLSGGKY